MKIKIAHLFPDILNLYGDMGNIRALEYRLRARNIEVNTVSVNISDEIDLSQFDIVFLGGGGDHETSIALKRLFDYKNEITAYIESGKVFVAACSGFYMLGKELYLNDEPAAGLSVLDVFLKPSEKRLIGNAVSKASLGGEDITVAAFENHNFRVHINNHTPFSYMEYGFGNNGEDKTEGVLYKNLLATNFHGPLLPKNPKICDWLIKTALSLKYGDVSLENLDDSAENAANNYIFKRCFGKK